MTNETTNDSLINVTDCCLIT